MRHPAAIGVLSKRLRGGWAPAVLLALVLLPVSASDSAVKNPEASIKSLLTKQRMELLMEKGVFDDQGREIRNRLGDIIQEAERAGRRTEKDIVRFVLDRLNDSPDNLAGFPACAFDRPIGEKLAKYGHTFVPSNIDATAEGSACPVGGIGAGAFERTMSGNFRTWFLKPGWMVDDTVWADQFHVFMKSGGRTFAQSLSADSPKNGELSSWKWKYPEGMGSYYALYPRSGFSYEKNSEWPVKLAVVQFSPVIPHNYRETSYPVAVYRWIAENPLSQPVEVSILLTWENMVGWEPRCPDPAAVPTAFVWKRLDHGAVNEFAERGEIKGIVFKNEDIDIRTGNAMAGTMAIAALETPGKSQVFHLTGFDPKGDGSEVWRTFAEDGTLAHGTPPAGKARAAGAALAVKFTLGPREKIEVPFVISWDFPFYEFEEGVKYRRKYTEFFGADGGNAFRIACEALDRYKIWEKDVDGWQATIVRDTRLPDWFKQALINELYVLAETSIWDASTNLHSYLESVDYLMYGTFDVDAYVWSVLKLWPELELGNMRFFAQTVDWEDPAYKSYLYAEVSPGEVPPDKLDYYWNVNKVRGMVPHDIGSPLRRPWIILNAFDWQNGNVWKDLNPKFPLRALRDYRSTGSKDMEFLKKMFKASVAALDTLERKFGDPQSHVPLNEGIPDQTYDTWRMKGESAMVGLLWLGALRATEEMGEELVSSGAGMLDDLDVKNTVSKYAAWFDSGRLALDKLWDDESGYFHIDAHTDDIMTDQLFGVWYAAMTGVETKNGTPIVPEDRVRRALRTIYEKNVLGYGGGLLGAVNGRSAAGTQLRSQQGDEVWVGTAYAFASNCILHGLKDEGMHTAYGVFHTTYTPFGQGYFFKSPEAYLNPDELVWNNPGARYGETLFRVIKYMRPGAIWAVYEALLKKSDR